MELKFSKRFILLMKIHYNNNNNNNKTGGYVYVSLI